MQIGIYPDINSLSHEAAQFIVRLANEAIVTRGRSLLWVGALFRLFRRGGFGGGRSGGGGASGR